MCPLTRVPRAREAWARACRGGSLAVERAGELSRPTRLLIQAASVLGDPFEPDLAAEVAELDESAGLQALDDLLARTLVRHAGAPRRFAFRHPLVRHAVYEGSAGGWRLGAHARAAKALERRGAGVVVRAHHVEHAANAVDETAIGLLTEAARALHAPAPASAAGYYEPSYGYCRTGSRTVLGGRVWRARWPTLRRPRAMRAGRARRC